MPVASILLGSKGKDPTNFSPARVHILVGPWLKLRKIYCHMGIRMLALASSHA